jgi:hypothetical protein
MNSLQRLVKDGRVTRLVRGRKQINRSKYIPAVEDKKRDGKAKELQERISGLPCEPRAEEAKS